MSSSAMDYPGGSGGWRQTDTLTPEMLQRAPSLDPSATLTHFALEQQQGGGGGNDTDLLRWTLRAGGSRLRAGESATLSSNGSNGSGNSYRDRNVTLKFEDSSTFRAAGVGQQTFQNIRQVLYADRESINVLFEVLRHVCTF